MTTTLRRIVHRERWRDSSCTRHAKGSVLVRLECGCYKRYKASKEPKEHARCTGECKRKEADDGE